jgi:16S rRNA processing protein RimM
VKDLLEIGKIVRIHGLKGAVKVTSYLESNDIVKKLEEIRIDLDTGPQPLKIKKIRLDKKGFLLELDGVESAEAAEKLIGREILIPSDQLDALPEGEYYWEDLIGLEVRTEEGEFLGQIETIFPTGSNDVYVCLGKEREILLPAIPEVVRKIDLEKSEMIVTLLEGL